MKVLRVLIRREFAAYFATPLAYVFMVVFLMLSGALTFYLGGLYESNQADLQPFFAFHPWLYLFFVPAVAMRLWAEERKLGTIELLLTLPVSLWQAAAAKFLAAWAFIALSLALTFPMWLSINYLGDPDNGAILATYLGSLLMAGTYLAIAATVSAATRNQVIAFVVGVTLCFLFTLAGHPLVLDALAGWAPELLLDTVASLSTFSHFQAISRGVIDLRDLIYFVSMAAAWLYASVVIVELKKGD